MKPNKPTDFGPRVVAKCSMSANSDKFRSDNV